MTGIVQPSIGILGTGSCLPKEVVTNEEVAARCGVTPEWIAEKTRILARRYAGPDLATSDLAADAARNALELSGVPAERIDYLVLSTSTGDYPQPPTSYLVQELLGASGAACFDVNAVCSGFVFALELARSLLARRPGGHALVLAADVYSRIIDPTDRKTASLFGDGAGAAVLGEVAPPYGIIDSELASRGDAHQLIRVEAGGSRLPASAETVAGGLHHFRMNGRGVRDFVAQHVPPVLRTLAARAQLDLAQIDHFVPHQANGVMLAELVADSGLSGARTHLTLDRYGNVGSASVPVALDEANRAGHLKNGDLVLLAGFGGGMAVGASLVRWGAPRVDALL